jgi:hypothetical protein
MKYIKPRRKIKKEIISIHNSIKKYGYIAGGCARYFASKDENPYPFGDIDVFCKKKDCYEKLEKIIDGMGYLKNEKKSSQNGAWYEKEGCYPVQLIKPFKNDYTKNYGSAKEMINNFFDFTIVKAYIISENKIGVDDKFDKDEKYKQLIITHINCPIGMTGRIIKYCKKGYKINFAQITKLYFEFHKRPDEWKSEIFSFIDGVNNMTAEDRQFLYQLIRFD